MFNHVTLGVNDLEVSRKFYDALLGTLGIGAGVANNRRYFFTAAPLARLLSPPPIDGETATHGNRSTIGFTMVATVQADAFHAAGVASGGCTCEDPPGWREAGSAGLDVAYLRDPGGNKLCALHRPTEVV
jgi:catechol 2,3-dioxygenase-like lactoylglutathione lyase family enzyme